MTERQSYQVLIAGSRSFDDQVLAHRVLDKLTSRRMPAVAITGGARGADDIGAEWATCAGVPNVVVRPDWKRFGKSAGYRRNEVMVSMMRAGDLVVIFYGPQGRSAGAGHTEDLARKAGLAVRVFTQPAPAAPEQPAASTWTPDDSSSEGHDDSCTCPMCGGLTGRSDFAGPKFCSFECKDAFDGLEPEEAERIERSAVEQFEAWSSDQARLDRALDAVRWTEEAITAHIDADRLAEEAAQQSEAFALIEFEASQKLQVIK